MGENQVKLHTKVDRENHVVYTNVTYIVVHRIVRLVSENKTLTCWCAFTFFLQSGPYACPKGGAYPWNKAAAMKLIWFLVVDSGLSVKAEMFLAGCSYCTTDRLQK